MVSSKRNTQSSGGEDRISQLPDDLICDILTRLPTKDSVRTSFLSTRWRNLCSLVPHFELDDDSENFYDLDAFVSCADRCFDTQTESSVHKLFLKIGKPLEGKASLLPWVDAVTSRKIQHLDISIDLGYSSEFTFDKIPLLPLSVYTCETLVHLELQQVLLVDAECLSLPCLKVLRFLIKFHNEAALEKLISGSPVLEDFSIMTCVFDKAKVLHVRSQSLKRIDIEHPNTQVVIDAPRLERLGTRLDKIKNYKILSLGFPAQVDFHLGNMRNGVVIRDIVTEISGVSDLTITSYYWKCIFLYSGPFQFYCLSRLKASFPCSNLAVLPNLLESCPKLETLILELYEEPMMVFSTVPPCFVSSLKFVELTSSGYEYNEGDLNLIRYILENSKILEKLSLSFKTITAASHDILKEQVVTMPRCSSTCQVYVL